MTEPEIADQLGRDRRTIEREVERGQVEHLNSDLTKGMVYNADRAQDVYEQNATAKGPAVKLKSNSAAVEFFRCHIAILKWSPEAVAARMKQKGMDEAVCAKTIYNHIDKGEIPGISNETLWEKRHRGKTHKSLYASWGPYGGHSRICFGYVVHIAIHGSRMCYILFNKGGEQGGLRIHYLATNMLPLDELIAFRRESGTIECSCI
jgi:intracellular sulfur oxidation DsrE/DsrF family protein